MGQRRLWSKSDLAVELERDRRTMSDVLRNVPPDGELNGRPAWFIMTAVRAMSGPRANARERKLEAEARLVELELARRLRQLCPAEQAVELIAAEYSIVKNRFLGIAAKLRPQIGPEAARLVDAEIYQALEELSTAEQIVSEAQDRDLGRDDAGGERQSDDVKESEDA